MAEKKINSLISKFRQLGDVCRAEFRSWVIHAAVRPPAAGELELRPPLASSHLRQGTAGEFGSVPGLRESRRTARNVPKHAPSLPE